MVGDWGEKPATPANGQNRHDSKTLPASFTQQII
jgi:hypothetical protein